MRGCESLWLYLLGLYQVSASAHSCRGRCSRIEPGAFCQCSVWCAEFGGCCPDFKELCEHRPRPKAVFTLPPSRTTTSLTTVSSTSRSTVTVTSVTRTTSATTTTHSATVVPSTTASSAPVVPRAPRFFRVGSSVVRSGARCGGFGPSEVWLQVKERMRKFVMYLPEGGRDVPLWLLLHGSGNAVDYFLRYSGLKDFAMANEIAFLALQGLPNADAGGDRQFDVGAGSEPMADFRVQDLDFVRELLKEFLRIPCLDLKRVHCTGYSNGGRFCVRLASELSGVIASIAPVSGLRFPEQNNATRPVPILAFHGDQDPVNPWWGHGRDYWHASVPQAMQHWAKFNGCRFAWREPHFLEAGRSEA